LWAFPIFPQIGDEAGREYSWGHGGGISSKFLNLLGKRDGDLEFEISDGGHRSSGGLGKNTATLYTGPKGVRFVPVFEKCGIFLCAIDENAKNLTVVSGWQCLGI
jgi:hypothetical protein